MTVGPRVRRTRRGFELRLSPPEREVLRSLPGQLRALVSDGDPGADPALGRLYPSAYLDDPDAARDFDEMTRDELTERRLAALEVMERTVDARRVNEDEMAAWLSSINDLRLVLGVRLAVTEESRPEDFAEDQVAEASFSLYAYLSGLEEEIVEALSLA
ncbi:MAG TPA: DUF2017 family protein [Actinomycetota bacterium]|nr:DUF2017 family protein [Actinomycetota bacterium]